MQLFTKELRGSVGSPQMLWPGLSCGKCSDTVSVEYVKEGGSKCDHIVLLQTCSKEQ